MEENWLVYEMIVKFVSKRQREEESSDEISKRRKDNEAAAEERQTCVSAPFLLLSAKKQMELKAESEDWANVYSYEEKRFKSLIEPQGYEKWEKQNWLWERDNHLVPLPEDYDNTPQRVYSYEEKRLKSLIQPQGYENWEKEHRSWEIENQLIPLAEEEDDNTPQRVYSYEEKRLKSLILPQGYENWEKEHRSWEIESRLIPLAEEEVYSEEEKKFFELDAKRRRKEEEKAIYEEIWKRQKELILVKDDDEYNKKDAEIYELLWNFQKQFLSEDEKEKKIKERQTYLELREKAIANPGSGVPFFPFGPGCVMPNFGEKVVTQDFFEIKRRRPLTEEEERLFRPGRRVGLPCFQPEPWDNRKFVPLTPETAPEFLRELQSAPSVSTTTSVISKKEKREKFAVEGRCLDGSYLTPYCMCDDASRSQPNVFEASYAPAFAPIFLAYKRQIRQSHCFDIDDYPCSPCGASVLPLEPHENFRGEAELLMEMANLAILEYNDKECNVFKYKVLKIEKVNYLVTGYFHYWMTVKALNLTLCTPIETFQIHAGISPLDDDDKFIYCCRLKEEAIVGLPSCDVCFGKLHREEALEL